MIVVDAACVVIRQARSEDAPFLAQIILSASRSHLSRGWFDIALDLPERGCLEFLRQLTLTRLLSLWHYSRFVIAESEVGPVAGLCAYRAEDAYSITPAAITEAVAALGLPLSESARIWERGAYAFTCTTPPGENCLVIDSIATLPAYRRRGYTTALLAHAVEIGRAQELTEAQITFLIGNDSAAQAYRRAGFRFAQEWRHPDFEAIAGSPGLCRFVKTL